MDRLQIFVDVLTIISASVALAHFFLPDTALDWIDNANASALSWLEQHRYRKFRDRVVKGEHDRLIMRVGSILMFLDFSISTLLKIGLEVNATRNITVYLFFSVFVFIFSMFAFRRYGIAIIRWTFDGRWTWQTILKTMAATVIAFSAGLLSFFMIVYFSKTHGSHIDFQSIDEMLTVTFPYFGYIFLILFILTLFVISIFAILIANGVVSTLMVFFLYYTVFMWMAWAIISAILYVVNRSLKRKGLAVLIGSISGSVSAFIHLREYFHI